MSLGSASLTSDPRQSWQSGEIIGDHSQAKAGSHPLDFSKCSPGHAANVFSPAEGFPDPFATGHNGEVFNTLREAQILIERWRYHYNTIRPHSALRYRPPAPESMMPIDQRPTMH